MINSKNYLIKNKKLNLGVDIFLKIPYNKNINNFFFWRMAESGRFTRLLSREVVFVVMLLLHLCVCEKKKPYCGVCVLLLLLCY